MSPKLINHKIYNHYPHHICMTGCVGLVQPSMSWLCIPSQSKLWQDGLL